MRLLFEASFLLVLVTMTPASSFGTHHQLAITTATTTSQQQQQQQQQMLQHPPSPSFFQFSPSSRRFFIQQQNQKLPLRGGGGGGGRWYQKSSSSSSLHMTSASTAAVGSDVVSEENLALLSERGRAAVERLVEHDASTDSSAQSHVYGDWPPPGTDDDGKKRLAEQVKHYIYDAGN